MEAAPYKIGITVSNMIFKPDFVLRLIKYILKV